MRTKIQFKIQLSFSHLSQSVCLNIAKLVYLVSLTFKYRMFYEVGYNYSGTGGC